MLTSPGLKKNRMILRNIQDGLIEFEPQRTSVDDHELEVYLSTWSEASARGIEYVANYDRTTFIPKIDLRKTIRF
jgi:hypothetical protein